MSKNYVALNELHRKSCRKSAASLPLHFHLQRFSINHKAVLHITLSFFHGFCFAQLLILCF
jgi:hypothetical protein